MLSNFLSNTFKIQAIINKTLMKSKDIDNAMHLFSSITNKSNYMYTVMFKGLIINNVAEKILDLFDEMKIEPNQLTLTILFNASAVLNNNRPMKTGKKLLAEMPENYRNHNVISTSAIDMLMKFGDVEGAETIFRSVKAKGADIYGADIYGALMNGYNLNGESWKCFKVFEEMNEKDIIPDEIAWNVLIGACSKSKYGSIEKAKNVFNLVVDRDTITYNAMINAFALNGMGTQAVELYRKMPNNLRDHISHICVLNACSHAGLLHEARTIFNEISLKTESIITTMVDCLSRLFMFDEAQKLIEDYEKTNTPSIVMYMSLLSGARNSRNSNLSEKIYKRMKTLFPNAREGLVSGIVLLSNIYSSLGKYEEAKHFRSNQIEELGVKVKVGLSWTEIKGHIQLKAHDHSHPQSTEIYAKIDRLKSKAIENGFIFDSSWMTRSLNENETIESVLCVVKNLRVCGHCHEFTKVIAKIEQCDIVVRDANRIHHFYPNGQCSCQDHF
ncbi:unnamed protein product [Rotaria magnacalcarata]